LAGLLTLLLALRLAEPPHVLLIALVAAAVALVLLWRIGYAHEQGRRLLRIGCALLVGSYAVHAFGTVVASALGYRVDSWAYRLKVAVKHAGELAGWFVVSAGLGSLLSARRHESAPGARRSTARSGAARMFARRARSRAGDSRGD
jgi:hypothetical protein